MKEDIIQIVSEYGEEGISRRKLRDKLCPEGGEYNVKDFDKAIEKLLDKGKIRLDDDDILHSSKEKKSNSKKRKRSDENEDSVTQNDASGGQATNGGYYSPYEAKKSKYFDDLWKNGEKYYREHILPADYLSTNPDQITRLFCGNLNKKVTEEQLMQCIDGIVYIKWITDKTTKEFYGSTFIEMRDPKAAITAVMQDGTKFLGRPLKIYYCPPKPGDVWPPEQSGSGHEHQYNPKGKIQFAKTPKPPNSRKLFMGNLPYDIDDNTIIEFFKDCGRLVGLRWMTTRDGGFRGQGYIEFATSDQADKAYLRDGHVVNGRPIRLDWTE